MTSIVLLHAFPLDERMWARQAQTFPDHDVIAPSLYGRGASFDAIAESLLPELPASFVAVGASMGGYLALAMARHQPERLEGIVLVGSRAARDTPERLDQRDATIAALESGGPVAVWAPDD